MQRLSHLLIIVLVLFSFTLAGCGHPVEGGILFKTADPDLSITFMFPKAVPDAPEEPAVVPDEEVGEATPVPPEALIKGNISSSGEKIYHVPGGSYYDQVLIDEEAGERWFVTEEEAVAAGWRKSSR